MSGTASPTELVMRILLTDEGRNDPYPLYDELRSQAPVFFGENVNVWYLSRAADCSAVLRSPAFGKGDRSTEVLLADGTRRERRGGAPSMLLLDPPDHTRIRSLVSRAFTPRRIEALRPEIERLTDEVLDEIGEPGEEVDLIDRFAFQLPVRVIAALVGVPDEDSDWFRPRTAALVRSLEPSCTGAEFDAADAAGLEIQDYMAALVAEKKKRPAEDLLSTLIEAQEAGDRLSEDEVISNAILMFTAGFETTTNLIGNGTTALFQHPEQRRHLAERPELWPNAIEEMLRFDGPVQLDGRTALEDAEIAGHQIAAGQQVITLLGAANHDPELVERPDEFDVTRDNVPILSFASGIHYCLGAALARMEGQVAMQRLFERFPDLSPGQSPPVRNDAITIRGFTRLPVRL